MFRGSIVALVTPFRNGSFDEQAYRELIDWHIESGTDALVPVGTTGESPTLSHAEHHKVVEVCIDQTKGRVPVIAGAGSNSTDEALSLTLHAQEAGADAVLIVTPYYNKPTQEGLFQHYRAIHDGSDIPIIIYNIPGRSIIDMSPATMARLAELPRIVGVKDSTADIVRPLETAKQCGAEFAQLSGEDGNAVAFLAHGGHGCISVTANIAPALCAEMHDAWAAGDASRALSVHQKLLPLHKALFCEASPAPAKYALAKLGRIDPEIRLPLVPLSEAGRTQVDRALREVGLTN